MVICLCATRNMYAQLQTMIIMLSQTQSELEHIYAFVEDDFESKPNDLVTFVNVVNYVPILFNDVNNGGHWTYMTMIRCYFTDFLPNESRVIYLDLDIMIEDDISELWEMDLQGHEIAGVVDRYIGNFNLPYIKYPSLYINSGSMLMDLDLIRKNHTDKKMHNMLNTWHLQFADQDTINLCCSILHIDCKWNSSDATMISPTPKINHVLRTKPWDPNSVWFPKWVKIFAQTQGKLCVRPY